MRAFALETSGRIGSVAVVLDGGVVAEEEFAHGLQNAAQILPIIDRLTRGSTLFQNQGDGTFTDVSDQAGVRDGQWGWAAEFLDYDNDGALDVYAVNGFLTGPLPDDV